MLRAIMRLLFDWDEAPPTSWDVWAILEQREPSLNYTRYKKVMTELVHAGRVSQTKPPKATAKQVSLAKSLVAITEAGRDWWADEMGYGQKLEESAGGTDVSALIGKRLPGGRMIPREQWNTLMRRFRAGELDIAFLPSKKTGGSSK